MPAQPLTPEQKEDAARLKEAFRKWQDFWQENGKRPSQIDVAAEFGMNQSAVSQYLNGQIPLNWLALTKFSKLLGVAPETISKDVVRQEQERASLASFNKGRADAEAAFIYFAREPGFDLSMEVESADAEPPRKRKIFISLKVGDKAPERLWGSAGIAATDEWADVFSEDPHAFACRVTGDSMVPRFMPGEYALVEPSIEPDIEDDVLVRLTTGESMLTRLVSRRMGVVLGTYKDSAKYTYRDDEISWMYYVAHPIPARRIRQLYGSKPLTKPRFDLK